MIEIPIERLSEDTLTAIIEEYITREGTEYGDREYSLPEKIHQVRGQLKSGKAVILFDEPSESCVIVPRSHLKVK